MFHHTVEGLCGYVLQNHQFLNILCQAAKPVVLRFQHLFAWNIFLNRKIALQVSHLQ